LTLPFLSKEAYRKRLAELKKKFDDGDKANKAARLEEVFFFFKKKYRRN